MHILPLHYLLLLLLLPLLLLLLLLALDVICVSSVSETGSSSGHGSPPEDVCRHITHPFTYCRWEGCLCIDLDDRIVGSQIHCVGSETVVVGGSRTIPEAHNFAKRRLRRTDNHHSQSFLGMNWVEIQKNSSDLGHYFCPPPCDVTLNGGP